MVDFGTVSKLELNSLLRQFYESVRNTKGQQYAISTYVGLRAGINRFVNDPPYSRAWCLMKDNEFTTSNNVWFDTQLHFGRRGKEGLRKLTPQSSVVKRDSAGTKYVTMAFNEETKNHKCHNDRERQNRRGAMFEEPGNALCSVAPFEAYLSTLPESAKAFYHHPRKS
ncbi:hypothetical protein JOQ06_015701 [Pogonophryne albipinna]|uniref:Uncharacterized protein n=1 Tax=Pogonophryne albipinna TaxID=1090488 RepID=A0AAD6FBN0_9TELE|nr:hypothetical protein JOQ06_015701 [Pogonophryne albipinna]